MDASRPRVTTIVGERFACRKLAPTRGVVLSPYLVRQSVADLAAAPVPRNRRSYQTALLLGPPGWSKPARQGQKTLAGDPGEGAPTVKSVDDEKEQILQDGPPKESQT